MEKTMQIKVPIFEVYVSFCTNRELARLFAKKNRLPIDLDIIDEDQGFLYFDNGQFFLCVFNGDYATLAHECFHCAMEILHWVKVPASYEGQETVAYLMEYLIKRFSKVLEDDNCRETEPQQTAEEK